MGGQRGRLFSKIERVNILNLINEACKMGASQQAACQVLGVSCKTIQRWEVSGVLEDKRSSKKSSPLNKLTDIERNKVLEVVNQPRYANLSPAKIVPLLADKGEYIASESTIYRILRDNEQMRHRQASKPYNRYKPKALAATQPNQIYSWDITYLASEIKGMFFYLYMILDIYSRKVVGWQVYQTESSEYASDVLEAACLAENVRHGEVVLHSDNGSPMKGATMLATLQRLGVVPSFNRPGVSNDNPYSESLFRTLKYEPKYPEKGFKSLSAAREWVAAFIEWYNKEHLHSGIKFVTPEQRHERLDKEILRQRHLVYQEAKKRHPSRWSKETRNWEMQKEVLLNPEKSKNEVKLGVAV